MSMLITIDPKNFNRHTKPGMELLEKSITEVGAIEGITIDKNGEIVSGNARYEVFDKLGYKPKVIELSENEYPVIQTELEGEKRVKAALYANTVSKKNIDFDIDLIQEIAVEEYGIDIEEIGIEQVENSYGGGQNQNNAMDEFGKYGEFEYKNDDNTAYRSIIISFDNEDDVNKFAMFTGLRITPKMRQTFFPQKEYEKEQEVYE